MDSGEFLVGEVLYDEMVIVPFPQDSMKYYIFQVGTSLTTGIYYSIVDLSYNGGLGKVTDKNIPLTQVEMFDGVSAIKNGNGRDWWVIFRPSNYQGSGLGTNDFYLINITPSGVFGPFIQSIGSLNFTDLGSIRFSHRGNKIVFVNAMGMIELYDFDRCSGVISNPVNIHPEDIIPPYPTSIYSVGAEFSPNDSVLYVSTSWYPSVILQYNLTASNIVTTEQIIASISYPSYAGGLIRLAPDNKIYWSCAWNDSINFNYPYPDSVFNFYNMNLSVISYPDSLGFFCDFFPFHFYLGGNRTYYDLPNNPDYDLTALGGSTCDTLGYPNGVNNKEVDSNNFRISPNPAHTTFTISAMAQLQNPQIEIYNVLGVAVQSEIINQKSEMHVDIRALAPGIYFVKLQSEKWIAVQKLLVE